MKRTFILLSLVLTMALTVAAECSDADKKALEAFDRSWGKAGQEGDKSTLMAIYADDYVGLPGMQGKADTIDATMKTFDRNKANPAAADKVTHDHYFISCTPGSATITHRNTVWTPDGSGGKPETFYTRSIHMLEKRGGKWMVVSNAGGSGLDDYDVLWYLEQDWNDAVLKKDRNWFEKNYAADFTSISGAAKLMSRAEDIADTVDDKGTNELVETTGMNIRVDGGFAVITGNFRVKGKDSKGVPFDRKVRYTDTWIKRDGRWQAWSSQGTPIPDSPQVAKN